MQRRTTRLQLFCSSLPFSPRQNCHFSPNGPMHGCGFRAVVPKSDCGSWLAPRSYACCLSLSEAIGLHTTLPCHFAGAVSRRLSAQTSQPSSSPRTPYLEDERNKAQENVYLFVAP